MGSHYNIQLSFYSPNHTKTEKEAQAFFAKLKKQIEDEGYIIVNDIIYEG